jgi:hypothetical protein
MRMFAILFVTALVPIFGVADEPTKQEKTQAGLRVFYTGHSFHMFVPARIERLVPKAGIQGHELVGTQGIGGSKVIQHWDLPTEKNKAKQALETGRVDVFTMAAHAVLPDPGIDKFTELGLKHNPNLRLLVQASWLAFDQVTPEQRISANIERDNTQIEQLEAATATWRKKLEAQVDALNKQHNRTAVLIVPAGNAVNALRKKIVEGSFPGITKQSELFRDPIGHGLGHIQSLATYCNFATIYRRSPEGFSLDEPTVTPDQDAILQRIAWETVLAYPYSGVSKAK